jgi:hypothetical protein
MAKEKRRSLALILHEPSEPSGILASDWMPKGLCTSDIGAQYFLDVASVVNAGAPPDKAALVSVMARYGLVPAAPSGA